MIWNKFSHIYHYKEARGDALKERREDLFCSGHMTWKRDLGDGEESFKNLMTLRDSTVVPLQRSLFRSHFKSIIPSNQFTSLWNKGVTIAGWSYREIGVWGYS